MNIKATVFTALFTALIAAGAFMVIPAGPVPVTLQTLFILLSGMLGGRKIGTSSVLLYLVLGTAGLPVFSGGTGGIAHLLGPTGGYLIGSIPAVFLAGLICDTVRQHAPLSWVIYTIGAAVGTITIYVFGIPWLKFVLGISWTSAMAAGLTPFIIGDVLKLIAGVIITGRFRGRVTEFLAIGA